VQYNGDAGIKTDNTGSEYSLKLKRTRLLFALLQSKPTTTLVYFLNEKAKPQEMLDT